MSDDLLTRPLIHFAHANGFVSSTYNYFFEHLAPHYTVARIEKIGHNPLYPITPNWPHLVDEVYDSVQAAKAANGVSADTPIIGLGHSLGAVLTLLCAYRYPGTFSAIILLEPPLQSGLSALAWRALSTVGMSDRFSPAGVSKHRRVLYDSREAVFNSFADKPFFKRFHPQCLEDYIAHGFIDVDEGVRLAFEREREVAIFRTLPSNIEKLARPLDIPSLVIQGKHSELVASGILPRAIKHLKLPTTQFNGGHMFPLEQPEATAALIHETLTRFSL